MEPRVNIITLGVKDLPKSRHFYENLGWKASSISNEHLVAFKAGGVVLCLYPEKLLAEDAMVDPDGNGFRKVTIAYNAKDKTEVDEVIKQASEVGAKILKVPQEVFWGGYSGYFSDPDGHLWEVAFNPHWPLIDGKIQLPD